MSGDYAVVHFASLDWAFRKQDQHFIAMDLVGRGHPVVYLENTGARIPGLADLPRVVDRLRNWARSGAADDPVPAGLRVVSPLCIPGASLGIERSLNALLLKAQVGPALRSIRGRPVVLWIGLPTWTALDVATWLNPALVIYYCGDALARLPGVRRGIVRSEQAVLRRADLVFAASSALVEHCRRSGVEPIHIPMALDLTASRPAREGRVPVPPELAGLRGRIIGYMGGLNAKVDVALLDAVAARFVDDTLVILGSVEDPRYKPRAAPNVVILGERPYERIGGYLARFDVCLIPYVLSEFTDAVNPAKLIEYLAVGRPVVSTPLREVLPYSDVVRVAKGVDGFVAAVEEVLRSPDTAEERERRVQRAEENARERIGALVDDLVQRALLRSSAGSDRSRPRSP